MKHNQKLAVFFDIAGAVCLLAGMIYLFFFSFLIYPPFFQSQIQKPDNVGSAFGIALGSGLALAVIITILILVACIGFIIGAYALFSAIFSRRYIGEDGKLRAKKKYLAFQIPSAVLQIAACIFIFIFAFSAPVSYHLTTVLCVLCLLFLIAGTAMKASCFRSPSSSL